MCHVVLAYLIFRKSFNISIVVFPLDSFYTRRSTVHRSKVLEKKITSSLLIGLPASCIMLHIEIPFTVFFKLGTRSLLPQADRIWSRSLVSLWSRILKPFLVASSAPATLFIIIASPVPPIFLSSRSSASFVPCCFMTSNNNKSLEIQTAKRKHFAMLESRGKKIKTKKKHKKMKKKRKRKLQRQAENVFSEKCVFVF